LRPYSSNLGEDEIDTLLRAYVKKTRKYVLVEKGQKKVFAMEQVAVLRKRMGISMNKLLLLDQFFRYELQLRIFPANLRERMTKDENHFAQRIVSLILPLQVNKNGKKQQCNFWYVEDLCCLLERMVVSAKLSGKFENSEDFSFIENKLVIVFGCDKGDENTTMLIRVANRGGGNNGDICQPIAQYENGMENHSNLRRTIYNPRFPVRAFLQHLIDDKLFGITIDAIDEKGRIIGTRCKIMQFFVEDEDDKELEDLTITLDRKDDQVDDGSLPPSELVLSSSITNLKLAHSDRMMTLCIQLIKSAEKDNYIGFRLLQEDNELVSYRFSAALRASSGTSLHCKVSQAVGFISHDIKHAWPVHGLGQSHSQHCPCLHCIQPSESWKSNPLKWLGSMNPDNSFLQRKDPEDKDAPLREGNNASDKLYQVYVNNGGDGQRKIGDKEDKELKLKVASTTNMPLLRIPPQKETMAPMHMPNGIYNHFYQHVRSELREVDKRGESCWMNRVKEVRVQAQAKTKEDAEFKRLNRENNGFSSRIKSLSTSINEAEQAGEEVGQNGYYLPIWRVKLKENIANRTKHWEESGYSEKVKLKNGASLLVKAIDAYLKEETSLPRGPAEYALNHSIFVVGAFFRDEHGGFALSHQHAIRVLERWHAVETFVSKAYPEDAERQKEVETIMEISQKVAGPLHTLCLNLKSQRLLTAEKLEEIKKDISKTYASWREHYSSQNPFPKLHHSCHIPAFVAKWGMYGRLSEEGFEATHPRMGREKSILKRMGCVSDRTNALSRRFQ
jgi:hypothetical protein